MEKWSGKVALVTGASSGIGQDIALALANAGMLVVGIARRAELVDALASQVTGSGRIYAKRCDVGIEAELMETFDWIRKDLGGVDVLICNAGVFRCNFITQSDSSDFRETFNVNVVAACICIREAVKDMKDRSVPGHIFIINSILGKRIPDIAVPMFGVYPASKYALTGLAEVVRKELMFFKLPIKLTSIHPGMVQTDMIKVFDSALAQRLPKLKVNDITANVLYSLKAPTEVHIEELIVMPGVIPVPE
ncbi:farnesol dehydrogenase [Toxorhynchites rutilus septentrionalis]|uniref:farnesol dehydrogenase n=1 Tax=Toxorhynchites rutilus septentrionalis TaxID=329112 RepID=UPI00247A0FE2|nr:farnesol dehydrogenase [Toxorhynchites rutilus septentrionalis]